MSKTLLAEPFGQRLWFLSTALSAYQVGQLHFKASSFVYQRRKNPQTAAKISSKDQQTLVVKIERESRLHPKAVLVIELFRYTPPIQTEEQ
jgi:hypothetical protein